MWKNIDAVTRSRHREAGPGVADGANPVDDIEAFARALLGPGISVTFARSESDRPERLPPLPALLAGHDVRRRIETGEKLLPVVRETQAGPVVVGTARDSVGAAELAGASDKTARIDWIRLCDAHTPDDHLVTRAWIFAG